MKGAGVRGTEGYGAVAEKFIEATQAIDFFDLHQVFVPFIPAERSRILDVGAGIGRDAFVFSTMGHSVTAVEPSEELRTAGKKLYPAAAIDWRNDALPALDLAGLESGFDFILASGVWHHLDEDEQADAMQRIAGLLNVNGVFALSLRHGPAGVGVTVFPTDGKRTIGHAEHNGLITILFLENQPSLMKNKEDVLWTKLVFQKAGHIDK